MLFSYCLHRAHILMNATSVKLTCVYCYILKFCCHAILNCSYVYSVFDCKFRSGI
uniref:Uncharacterized protein n=1 Tax=Arundo donax TaxID=35708 RepID=A0A0A9BFP7_ARUDO